MMAKTLLKALVGMILLSFTGCSESDRAKHEDKQQKPVITNRIKVSSEIISNLGITFERVSSGKLGTWITVPGKLQIPREDRFVLSAPTKGRIFWAKDRLSWLSGGDVVATIESPALSAAQQELGAALQNLHLAEEMKDNGSGSLLRLTQAERKCRECLGSMALLTGFSSEELGKEVDGAPFWSMLRKLEVRAPGDGYLFEVHAANGEILEEGAALGLILNATRLVFRGLVPSDLHSRIPDEAVIRIDVNDGHRIETRLKGPLPIGDKDTSKVWVEADVPNDQNDLIDGAAVISHIQIEESAFEEAIVPECCVVFDQLQAVIFRRDVADSDFVIRTPIEIGNCSGGCLEVVAGVLEGDEIVRDGVHQLRRMGSVNPSANGHFHADGTWHEGDD